MPESPPATAAGPAYSVVAAAAIKHAQSAVDVEGAIGRYE
jgi:hypothetical protein